MNLEIFQYIVSITLWVSAVTFISVPFITGELKNWSLKLWITMLSVALISGLLSWEAFEDHDPIVTSREIYEVKHTNNTANYISVDGHNIVFSTSKSGKPATRTTLSTKIENNINFQEYINEVYVYRIVEQNPVLGLQSPEKIILEPAPSGELDLIISYQELQKTTIEHTR